MVNQELSRYWEEARKAKEDSILAKNEPTSTKDEAAHAISLNMFLQEQMSSLMDFVHEMRRNQGGQYVNIFYIS